MTAVDVDALEAARAALAAAMPEHQSWCHAEAHGDCCGADDCDCGVADSLDRLLPVVERIAFERAAAEVETVRRWLLETGRADAETLWQIRGRVSQITEATS